MRRLITAIVATFFAVCTVHAQYPASWVGGLNVQLVNNSAVFDDSVWVDTTGLGSTWSNLGAFLSVGDSATVDRLFGRGLYHVVFHDDVFDFASTTLDDSLYLHWGDVDTAFSQLRDSLQAYGLSADVGSFTFVRHYPNNSTGGWERHFYIVLDSVRNMATAFARLASMPDATVTWINRPTEDQNYWYYVDKGMHSSTKLEDIMSDDPPSFITDEFHQKGWQWGLHRAKVPLAWEITKGRKSVTLGFRDTWGTNHTSIDELFVRDDLSDDDDNKVLVINESTWADTELSHAANLETVSTIGKHGLRVMSIALAEGNRFGTAGRSGQMIGVCPNCTGVAFNSSNLYQTVDSYSAYDTDFLSNGVINRIDVLNVSQWSVSPTSIDVDGEEYITLMEKGIAVVGAQRNNYGGGVGIPSSVVDLHGTDPDLDVKVISVSASQDGWLYDAECEPLGSLVQESFPGGPYRAIFDVDKAIWKGNEQFYTMPAWVSIGDDGGGNTIELATSYIPVSHFASTADFSHGVDKFDVSSSRLTSKRTAFSDVLAPSIDYLFPNGGDGALLGRKYAVYGSAVSQGTSMVSGVLGLMFSVNKFMGLNYDATTDIPSGDPLDVQRRAYNLLTLTADRILDNGKIRTRSGSTMVETTDPHVIGSSHEYNVDNNDHLSRWWSQRMGFGRINAFRSVAHSIRHKATNDFTTSTTLPFAADDGTSNTNKASGYVNEDGKMLMHMGAYRHYTRPGQTPSTPVRIDEDGPMNIYWPQHFSYFTYTKPFAENRIPLHLIGGETGLVADDEITITVSSNSTLAIDGVVYGRTTSEELNGPTNLNHKIVAMSSGAKIVAEAFFMNIGLVGSMTLGDCVFEGKGVSSAGYSEVYSQGRAVRVFGDVYFGANSRLYVDESPTSGAHGSLLMAPGSSITLRNGATINVTDTGTLHMEDEAIIFAASDGSQPDIIVSDGATLYIDRDADVAIDANIRLINGGRLIVEYDATLRVKHVVGDQTSVISILEGGCIQLIHAENPTIPHSIYTSGRFVAQGTTEKPARVESVPNACHDRQLSNPNYTYPKVYMIGTAHAVSGPLAELSLVRTNTLNVHFKLIDTKVSDVSHCNFVLQGPALGFSCPSQPILSVEVTNPSYNLVRNMTFLSSRFFYDVPRVLAPKGIGTSYYCVTGLSITRGANVVVDDCEFKHCNRGLEVFNTFDLRVLDSRFLENDFGTYTNATASTLFCSDRFYDCNNGVLTVNGATVKVYDSEFVFCAYGFESYTVPPLPIVNVNFRNDLFQNNVNGIRGMTSNLNLGPAGATIGYNNFVVDVDLGENPWYQPPMVTADIFLANNPNLVVVNGENRFSANAQWHVQNVGAPFVLNVGTNMWRPACNPRLLNVNPANPVNLCNGGPTDDLCTP